MSCLLAAHQICSTAARLLAGPCNLCALQQDSLHCAQVLRIVPTKSAVSPRFYLTRIMPIGLGMSLALLFGNLVYLQLSMSFIQMLKVRLGRA